VAKFIGRMECVTEKLCQESVLVQNVPLLTVCLEQLALQTSILMVIFVAAKWMGALNLISVSVQTINHLAKVMCTA